jgi:uncharacterized protein
MTPVAHAERISSLDVVRGFALLGILLLNVGGLAMSDAAYNDPTLAGGSVSLNVMTWLVLHVLAEGKMRCLFSMLFGAGIVLFTSRVEQRSPFDAADIYFRRIFWLLLFGIAHAFLLWHGDILYPYALCALVLYPCRRWSAKSLLALAGVLIVTNAGASLYGGWSHARNRELAMQADAAEAKGLKPSDEQDKARKAWKETIEEAKPTREVLDKDARRWRGSFLEVLKVRAEEVGHWHAVPYYHPWNWDVWSMMLIGMALLKLEILTAKRSRDFYMWCAVAGYAVGVPVNWWTGRIAIQTNFDIITGSYLGVTYDIGRLAIALAHMSVLILLVKGRVLAALLKSLAAVGQMALSNYILQSVICAFVFTGYGFALYGTIERYQIYYVVAAIWAVQMIVSPVWLKHFQFGPAEWLWRSLTYWKRQPFRARPSTRAISEAAAM